VAPVEALRETRSTYFKSLRIRVWIGGGITAAGILLLFLGLFTDVSNGLAITGVGAGVVFLGISVLAPLFARAFGLTAGAPLPRLFGVTGRLAQENSVRKPRRTAATASALMIGVALVSVIATLAASLKGTLIDTVGEEVTADFQVQAGGFGDPTQSGLSPAIVEQLRELPETETVAIYRIGAYRNPETLQEDFLLAVEPDLDETVRLEPDSGSFDDLVPGTVAIWDRLAEDEGLAVGDTLRMEFNDGAIIEPTVVFVFGAELFTTNVMIPMETYDEHFTNRLAVMALITVPDGLDPEEARPAIQSVVDTSPNLQLNDEEEYIDQVAGQIDAVLNILTALLAMAILIALLGITNTMALSIMERRREIGLLRAVGMTRRQVKQTIRWEAMLIAVFGAVIGIVVGVGLGIAVVFAIGQGLGLSLPWTQLLLYLAAAAAGGVVASLLPARRGARLDVLEAIAYE
jgi:putative ABC transport system permease protein